ncbi:MAG: hypothetical protein GYA55_14565, partial [SAR324 cluster bacterium]|nr:hypothetical protein [SAR324 cluster bacterium]
PCGFKSRLGHSLDLGVFEFPESIKNDLRTSLEHSNIVAQETAAIDSIVEAAFTAVNQILKIGASKHLRLMPKFYE